MYDILFSRTSARVSMLSIPQNLKKYFDLNILKKRAVSVVGVDVGSSAIKVVQLKNKGGVAVLETYGELSLGPYGSVDIGQATTLAADKLGAALADILREASVTATSAGVSIPFTSSLVTLIHLPSAPRQQLATMIPIEARKYVPVPISEVSLDWFIVPEEEHARAASQKHSQEKQKKTDVLLVAIHNDVLHKFQQIAQKARLDISFYEIEIFSSIRATLRQSTTPVVVLDMGAATTKLYVVELGIIRASHLIHRGGQDLTQALSKTLGVSVSRAEEMKRQQGLEAEGNTASRDAMLLVLDHTLSEANRVLLNYQKRYGKNVGKTVLTGGGAVLKGLLPLAQKHLETEVELANPFSKAETPAVLEDVLKEVGPEFSVAFGLALRKLQEYS